MRDILLGVLMTYGAGVTILLIWFIAIATSLIKSKEKVEKLYRKSMVEAADIAKDWSVIGATGGEQMARNIEAALLERARKECLI